MRASSIAEGKQPTMPARRLAPLLILAAVIASATFVAIAGTASAKPGVVIGIEQNGGIHNSAHRNLILNTQQQMGARVVRVLLRYDQVARCNPATRGSATSHTNPCYDFSVFDGFVDGAAARGMRVVLSVYGVPRWVFGRQENYLGTTDAEFNRFKSHYAQFVQAAATRYDGRHSHARVGQWTIWNEPNGAFMQPRTVRGRLVSPQRYGYMYDAAARRIKGVDSSLRVAAGPTAPHASALPPIRFWQGALPVIQRLRSPVDAVAHNAYMGSQGPLTTTIKSPYVGLGNIRDLAGQMDQFPITRGKPVWITEFGYQSGGVQKAVNVDKMARLTAEVLMFAYAQPRIDTFIWYSLHDDEETGDIYSFQSGLFFKKSRSCGGTLCPKPVAGVFLHTLWMSGIRQGQVTLWGQGRMAPASTRIYVQRPNDGWRAYSNADTTRTGTVSLRMALPRGTRVMTCDVRCGPMRIVGDDVSGGGGVAAKRRIQRLPAVRLAKGASLRYGVVFDVPCRGCRVSSRVIARGRASNIRAARTKLVIVGRSRVRGIRGGKRVHVLFTRAARRELGRRRSSSVTLRTYIRANGRTSVTDRLLILR